MVAAMSKKSTPELETHSELLTFKELAAFLHISERQLRRLVKNHETTHIPFQRLGPNGTLRFDLNDIKAWLRQSGNTRIHRSPNET